MPFLQCLGECFGVVDPVVNRGVAHHPQPMIYAAQQVYQPLPAQVVPRPIAPIPVRPVQAMYRPSQGYEPQELVQFLQQKLYTKEHKSALLNDLAFYLEDGSHPRKLRIDVFSALASNMDEGQEIWVDDVPRQRDFFGNAAVDLIFEELDVETTQANRDKLAASIGDLVTKYAPNQAQFTIGGIQRTREQLLDWILEFKRPGDDFANNLEAALRNAFAESVHNIDVRKHGALVFDAMTRLAPSCAHIPYEQTQAEVLQQFADHPRMNDLNRALVRMGLMIAPNPEVGFDTNLPGVLTVLWNYIKGCGDPIVKAGLEEALQQRLLDIHVDKACCTGCIERLLDVPSGVDPRLSIFNRAGAVRDEVANLASGINERFATLFEGTELGNADLHDFLDSEFITELKTGMLTEAAKQELKGVRGLAPSEFENEIKRMIEGFA